MEITKVPKKKLLYITLGIIARLVVALFIFWSAYLDLKNIKKNSQDLSLKYKLLYRNLHRDYELPWLPLPSLINENASALLIGLILTRLLAASSLVLRINYIGFLYVFYWFAVLAVLHNPLYVKKEALYGILTNLLKHTIVFGVVLMMSSEPAPKKHKKKSRSTTGFRSRTPAGLSSSFIGTHKPSSQYDANQLLGFQKEAVGKFYDNKGLRRSRSPLHQSSINFAQPVDTKEIYKQVKATKISDLWSSNAKYVPVLQDRYQQQRGLRTEPSTTSTTDREIGHFRRAAEIDNIKKNPPGPKKWKSSIRRIEQPPSECYYDVRKRELKTAGPQKRRDPIVEGDEPKTVTTREEYRSPLRSHVEKLKEHYLPATRGEGESPPRYSPISRYLYEKQTIDVDPPLPKSRSRTPNPRDNGDRMKSLLQPDCSFTN